MIVENLFKDAGLTVLIIQCLYHICRHHVDVSEDNNDRRHNEENGVNLAVAGRYGIYY